MMCFPRRFVVPTLVMGAGLWVLGCAQDSNSGEMRQRQDAAMRDPFRYSPDMDRTDISGGSPGNLNRDAMGKDLNDLLNP